MRCTRNFCTHAAAIEPKPRALARPPSAPPPLTTTTTTAAPTAPFTPVRSPAAQCFAHAPAANSTRKTALSIPLKRTPRGRVKTCMRAIVTRAPRSRHPRRCRAPTMPTHTRAPGRNNISARRYSHPFFAKSHSILMGNCASARGHCQKLYVRADGEQRTGVGCSFGAVVLCGPTTALAAAESLNCACGKIIYDQYLLNRWIFVCRSDRTVGQRVLVDYLVYAAWVRHALPVHSLDYR